jgi:serine/threonine protein kinase
MNGKSGEYEGRTVGDRRLDCLLGVRGNTAFYLNEGRRVDQLIELVPEGGDSTATVASWKRALHLRELQLLRVHTTGTADLDGTSVAYAVLDLPQDDLGEMLSKRKLDEKEARTMFTAVAGALHSLHQRGLAHGAVKPSNIFVVDDEIRLSVDTLERAGKTGKDRDLLQFAATLVKAMTGCADQKLVDAPSIAHAATQLAAPFRQIAVGCVGGSSRGKWTASRVVETLTGRAPETKPGFHVSWPVLAGAGVGVAVLVFYLLLHGPSRPTPPTKTEVQPTPAPVEAVVPTPRAPEPKPRPKERQPAPPAAGAADRNLAPQRRAEKTPESWAVIAGTYAQFEAAQKHAKMYGQQLPEVQPHVFPPDGQGKRYFIVLASGLTQEAAERLRQDVVEQGAPRDTYVTKIAEP